MASRQGYRRGGVLGMVVVSVLALALAAVSPPAHGASVVGAAPTTVPSRPVAYARVAVVRVLAYYIGTGSDGVPIPEQQVPCAADGVLIGTTGDGLNPANYVLVPTDTVNPITPCLEV
nr:hypothetical protein [Ktedonobacterales bacterium]